MLTLRALPGRADPGNSLLAAYHEGLARHWPLRRRMLARALAAAGKGGWSRAESLLLDDAVRAQGLSMRDRKGLHRLLNPGAFPFQANPLKNKQLFARIAEAAGLPVAEQWDPDREPLALWLGGQQDVIAKPSYRSKGQGVERFRRTAGGWKRDDASLDEVVVAAHLRAVREAGGVVQRRLPTHQALEDVSPGALPTLRVVTCLDEQGEPEACETALRLSAGGPRPVDNFNAGNLVLPVDGRGRCGPAWLGGGEGAATRHAAHPATGAPIAGRIMPDHDASLALALSAHRHFREGFTVIGWDIGLTAEGPVLVEGNWNPGTDIVQLVQGKGLGATRLGALYRHHLARLPAQRWRAAGAVEREPRRA